MRTTQALLLVLATIALVAPTGLTDWSQFRHDDHHTGTAEEPGAIQAPYEPWTFDANGAIISSPAVTDVDGERTIVFGSYPGQTSAGTLYALDADGNTLWSTTQLGGGGYIASPTVEDLDGDGDKEVVIPSLDDSTLRVFDAATGDQTWSTQVGSGSSDLLASSPIVADVDGSPGKEIVFGGSTSDQNGSLLIYDDEGNQVQAIELDGPAWSTPLYEDLDDDGDRELFIASGVPSQLSQLFPTAKTGGQSLYGFERSGGDWSIDWQTELSGPSLASPTAEDLDGDGTPEIVVGAEGGHFYAVDPDDGTIVADHTDHVGPLVALSSPAVGDIDDDGTPEVVVGVYNGVQALELTASGFGSQGKIELPQVDGQDPWVGASPALADIDGDDKLDVLAATVPIEVTPDIINSDALPGTIFAVDGAEFDLIDTQPMFTVSMPDDGGLSGPTVADVDGDGRSEVLAGEGIPLIGNGSTMHLIDAANPVVEEITTTPQNPLTIDEITFQADASDEDTPEEDLTYAWSLGDGTTASGPQPTHSYDDDGTYDVSVDVSDPDGHTWTQTRTLTVANTPPTVDADVTTTPDSLTVELDGDATDPDGDVTAERWELGDGTTHDGSSLTHTYPTGGSYPATFQATDDDGDTSVHEQTIHVNRFPTLAAPSDTATDEASPVTLSFTYDDPDGDAVHVDAVHGAPGAEPQILPDEDRIEVTWTPGYDVATREDSPVPVDVELAIEDEGQPAGTVTDVVTVEVANTNRAPAIAGPAEAKASSGQETVIEGTTSDPDGNPVSVQASGLPSSASLSSEEGSWRITVNPPASAPESTHDVTLTVDDGLDQQTHALELSIVPNQPPSVSIQAPSSLEAHTEWNPNPVTLEGTAQDPDGDAIDRWRWAIGDIVRHGPQLTHRFTEHGTYDVELTAWDELQDPGHTTHTIEVDDALTGDVTVHRAQAGPHVERVVDLQIRYDDGTPLAEGSVDLELVHEGLGETTANRTVQLDGDGRAQVPLQGDLGLGLFLPGEHEIHLETEADSLPSAPVQDTETLTMRDGFSVSMI